MKNLFKSLIVLAALLSPIAVFAVGSPAQVGTDVCKVTSNQAVGCSTSLLGANSEFSKIITVVIFIVGAISVLMIVIGGLRYTLSGGDPAGIRSAKDTILYALVGVVVAMLAYAIVQFIITRV